MMRFALINFGNEESYGLLFVGEELKKHGEIKFFDAEFGDNLISNLVSYSPSHLCFSPMSTFFSQAKRIEREVKEKLPNVISVYGGHHASNSGRDCGDTTVIGAIHGFDPSSRGICFGGATLAKNLKTTSREEYYRDIPRMRNRYRKVMLSVVGCPWNCSYCSSALGNFKRMYGETAPALQHRSIDDLIAEAKFFKPYTHEVEWVDDDILYGDYDWYEEFFLRWQEEIGLPMYVSATSKSILKAPNKILDLMRGSVNCVGVGVQAIRPESLKILGRAWDNESQIKEAYDKLISYGYRVNLQGIIGLPVADPIQDALDTVDGLVRIGKGSIASVYPLQIYPNTRMEKYATEKGFLLNDICGGDTNSGDPAINFGLITNQRIKNICKLATMVVKFGISRDWLEAMLDIELGEASKAMSLIRYFECMNDRLPEKAKEIFKEVTGAMHVRY